MNQNGLLQSVLLGAFVGFIFAGCGAQDGSPYGGSLDGGFGGADGGSGGPVTHGPLPMRAACDYTLTPGGCFSEYNLSFPSSPDRIVGTWFSRTKLDAAGVAFNTFTKAGGALTIQLTINSNGTWSTNGFLGYQIVKEFCPDHENPQEHGRYEVVHDAEHNVERVTFHRDNSNGRTNLPDVTLSIHAADSGKIIIIAKDVVKTGLSTKPPYFFTGLPVGDNSQMHFLYAQSPFYYHPHFDDISIDPCKQ